MSGMFRFSPLQDLDSAARKLLDGDAARMFERDGLTIFGGLAVIIICWHGIASMLSDRQGGLGFDMGAFARLVMQLAFGLTLILGYTRSIGPLPPFRDLVLDEAAYLAGRINGATKGNEELQFRIEKIDLNVAEKWSFREALTTLVIRIELIALRAVMLMVTGFTVVALAVMLMLGPLFIPWFIVPKLDFLFWGWLKATLATAFMKVVAAAFSFVYVEMTLVMLKQMEDGLLSVDPISANLLGVYCLSVLWGMTKVPQVTMALFSGTGVGSSGFVETVHSTSSSVVTGAVMRGGGGAAAGRKAA